MSKQKKTIAELKLFESYEENHTKIIRVPGGYLYIHGNTSAFTALSPAVKADLAVKAGEGEAEAGETGDEQ